MENTTESGHKVYLLTQLFMRQAYLWVGDLPACSDTYVSLTYPRTVQHVAGYWLDSPGHRYVARFLSKLVARSSGWEWLPYALTFNDPNGRTSCWSSHL